jgi:zinc transport system permease protein
LLGAFVFVLFAGYLLGRSQERRLRQNDLLIGILWSVGVAIGIIFINRTPGYAPDLMIFLFGNILTVTNSDLKLTFLLVLVAAAVVGVFYKGFVAVTLDEQYARTRRLPVSSLKMALMMVTALSIVILIQAVGILLVLALLTIPVAISSELSPNFRHITYLSIALGCLVCLGGLAVSFFTEAPAGASIILVGAALLGLVKGVKRAFVLGSHFS